MWVKICANTNPEDALAACKAGADAVGFVFAKSSRQVTAEQVAGISPALPSTVERVGVFGALNASEIAEAVRVAGLNTVQLHGGYVPDLTRELTGLLGPEVAIIQTVHWTIGEDDRSAEIVSRQLGDLATADPGARVLIDAKIGASPSGGTGVPFDWEGARSVFASRAGLRLILAGGLRPENVAEAIRTLHPWGVDVASGVEISPGQKDWNRVRDFVRNAREV